MAGYERGLDPKRNQFNHELSYTNYSYTQDEHNQQLEHGDQTYSSNPMEDYLDNGRYNESGSFPVVHVNSVNSIDTATGQQYSGNSEREKECIPEEKDKSEGRHDRRLKVAEIGALRACHRALRAEKMKSMKTVKEAPVDNMSGVEPIAVTFVDKKSGIEWDALGRIVPPKAVGIGPQATAPGHSDDAILPDPEKPSPRGCYYPPENNPQHPPQLIEQHGRQPYVAQASYGYDHSTSNGSQYDPHVPSHQHTGQPRPEWQGGTFYPSDQIQATQPYIYNQPPPVVPYVSDNLGCSIFVFLCCCWPMGLAALSQSLAAKESARRGNYAEAIRQGKSSRIWSMFGVFLGVVCYITSGVIIYYKLQAPKSQ